MSVDPGETSGWVITEDYKLITFGQVKDWQGLDEILFKYNPHIVVYEAFNLYAGQATKQIGQSFITVQVIGIIRYLCQVNDIPCYYQGANCKLFYSDKKLTEMGFNVVGSHKDTHWVDALRHVFYYLKFGGKVK